MTDRDLTLYEPFTATMGRRFRVHRVIHTRKTPYQLVEVVETDDFGVTLFLDRRFQTSEKDEFFYHESLVHPAMMLHPNPERVLIIGGGDGGTLEEVLKHPSVAAVTMVELDADVVDVAKAHLRSICGAAFEDPRVRLVIGDGRRFVEETDHAFDVILLDLTDPMEPSKYVYTKEFYGLCARRLARGGILGLHNDSPFFFPQAYNVITKTLDAVFPHRRQYAAYIVGYMLDFAFSVCAMDDVLEVDEKELARREAQRGIAGLLSYTPQLLERFRTLPGYMRRVLDEPCHISTDAAPFVIETEPFE
uniref:Polyamine aminopropyltransferase n=1 Tax=Desulfacinum infernum TaxID=35837 RepID=A0A832EIE7_9BACT